MIPSKTLNDLGAGEGSYGAGSGCLWIAESKSPGDSVIRLYDSGEAQNKGKTANQEGPCCRR